MMITEQISNLQTCLSKKTVLKYLLINVSCNVNYLLSINGQELLHKFLFFLANKTIFGGMFATSLYQPPAEFCWDYNCEDDSIDDDPDSSSYNLDEKVSLLIRRK